jgi:subtilisin-like proprotein convertase family protein
LWEYFYTSPWGLNSNDVPGSIAIDNGNNIIVTGSTSDNFNDSVLTLKLSSSGNLIWKKTIGGQSLRVNKGTCILSDNNSNIYIGGYLNNPVTDSRDALLIKYNSAGDLLWQRTYNYISDNLDAIMDMKFDNSGNVVVTGCAGVNSFFDSSYVLLQKYSSTGSLIWTQTFRSSNPSGEFGAKLLIDNNNNNFVMCRTKLYYMSNNSNIVTLKYNSAGALQWNKMFSNYFADPSDAHHIAFDSNFDVLIGGEYKKYYRDNLLILKYSNISGNLLWTYLYNKSGSSRDLASFINYGTDGYLYAAGNTDNLVMSMKMRPTNSYTYTLRRELLNKPILDSQYTYDTIYLNTDILPPLAYIRSMNLTIDSIMHTATGDLEISLLNNQKEDTLVYRRGGPLDNFIGTNLNDTSLLNICNGGMPPYTGYFAPCRPLSKFYYLPGSGPWILKIFDRKAPDSGVLKSWSLTLTYETTISVEPISTEIPEKYLIFQNYPNPFNPSTKIRFQIPKADLVKLTVYDLLGREIVVLINDHLGAGTFESDFDASLFSSGVYFYKLTAGSYTETKKMILVK